MLEALDVDPGGAVYLPYAQSLLRKLKATLNATGMKFGRKILTTPDGMGLIIVRTRRGPGWLPDSIPFSPELRVDTWLDSIRIEGSCPSYISGLVDRGVHAMQVTGTNPDGSPIYADGLYRFQPATWYADGLKKTRGWWTPGNGKNTLVAVPLRLLPEPPVYSIGGGWEFQNYTQAYHLKPGLYTGKMREVVQYLLGVGSQVTYDYHFARTHGVLSLMDTDPITLKVTTTDWLIEISASNGVLAKKLPVCIKKVGADNSLEYVPTAGNFPTTAAAIEAAILSGGVLRLATPDKLSEFYSRQAFFNECGWAFSDSGAAAQNTCYSTSGQYKQAYRYRISIATALNTEGKMAPTSATVSIVEQGYMIGSSHVNMLGQMQVPNYGLGGNVTVDMTPNFGPYQLPFNSDCPLYVYYDGEVEQVVRWGNEIPPQPVPSGSLPNNYLTLDAQWGTDYVVSAGEVQWLNHALSSPARDFVKNEATGSVTTYSSAHSPSPVFVRATGFTGSTEAFGVLTYIGWSKASTVASHFKIVCDSVVIPMYEREMVYHYRSTATIDTPGPETRRDYRMERHTAGLPFTAFYSSDIGPDDYIKMAEYFAPLDPNGWDWSLPVPVALISAAGFFSDNFPDSVSYAEFNGTIDLTGYATAYDGLSPGTNVNNMDVAVKGSSALQVSIPTAVGDPWTLRRPDALETPNFVAAIRSFDSALYMLTKIPLEFGSVDATLNALGDYQLSAADGSPAKMVFVGSASYVAPV
jgi:hypothetical protein